MRRILIDTDTASDDAVALLMALREPNVRVEAITVVAGNSPLRTCVRNALTSVEQAATYAPPVHAGMARPLLRDLFTAEFVHGEDGMGDMDLPDPTLEVQSGHAVDAIIEHANRLDGELEVITLGPLTNLAMALLKDPALAGSIKHVHVMGGAGLGPGNITPVAEFNFYVDAEAAHVVVAAEVPKTIVGWDASTGDTFMGRDDLDRLREVGPLGAFAVRCNATLIENNRQRGRDGCDWPDPVTAAAALYPELVRDTFTAHAYVDYRGDASYGQFVIDQLDLTQRPHNVTICRALDAARFKDALLRLLA